jgi:hypothetical protein
LPGFEPQLQCRGPWRRGSRGGGTGSRGARGESMNHPRNRGQNVTHMVYGLLLSYISYIIWFYIIINQLLIFWWNLCKEFGSEPGNAWGDDNIW